MKGITAMTTTAKKPRKKIVYHQTAEETNRRAHCQYCKGKGPDMMTELVTSPLGISYRIPVSHTACKKSILSLSLSVLIKLRCAQTLNLGMSVPSETIPILIIH